MTFIFISRNLLMTVMLMVFKTKFEAISLLYQNHKKQP